MIHAFFWTFLFGSYVNIFRGESRGAPAPRQKICVLGYFGYFYQLNFCSKRWAFLNLPFLAVFYMAGDDAILAYMMFYLETYWVTVTTDMKANVSSIAKRSTVDNTEWRNEWMNLIMLLFQPCTDALCKRCTMSCWSKHWLLSPASSRPMRLKIGGQGSSPPLVSVLQL